MSLHCYKYRLPFREPLQTSSTTFTHRQGLILEYEWDSGRIFGEAAPLPGFSKESLDEVTADLEAHRQTVTNILRDDHPVDSLSRLYEKHDLPPSLQFGLDALGYQMLARRHDAPLRKQLFEQPMDTLPANALGHLQSEDFLKATRRFISAGFQTLKFKVGINFQTELSRLKKIRDEYPHMTIRLDANGAWTLDEASQYCRQLQPLDIEYCEEPLAEPSPQNFERLSRHTDLPLALDESLLKLSYWPNLLPYCSFTILKPMLVGSFTKNLETKRLANTHNNKVVYTTSLESGLGRWLTANLASGSGSPTTAHGLTTGSLLTADIYPDDSYIVNGYYQLDSQSPQLQLDRKQIQHVSSKLF